MNKKLLSIALGLVMTMACATTAFASEDNFKPKCKQPPCKMMKHNPHHKKIMHQKMIQEQKKLDEILKLTPEQKDKLDKNKEQSKAKMKPIMQKMAKKKYELEKVMLSDASKETKKKKVTKIKKEMRELKFQADTIRKDDFKYFISILDETQKADFDKYMKEKKEQRKAKFQKPCKKHKPMPLPLKNTEK